MIIEFTMKEIRKQKGISLQMLEKETSINRRRLSDIENNKITDKVLFVEILLIAKFLEIDIKDLFVIGKVEVVSIEENKKQFL